MAQSPPAPLTPLPNPPKPLPQVPGPKLAPFTRTACATIEFVQELGNPSRDQDSHVWKVKIWGKKKYYVLKMFTFNSIKYLISALRAGLTHKLASPQLYSDYFDPFNCECRAYGRLKQDGREDLAIRVHGYLFLTPQQADEVERRASGPKYTKEEQEELDINFWARDTEHLHLPVRAIVKDFVSPQDPFTPEHASQMWNDLEDLHRLGILVRDITTYNYMGGKLIDFSRAWTAPHPFSEVVNRRYVEEEINADPCSLQRTFIEWGMPRDWDWDVIPEELINCMMGKGQNGPYGYDPSLCDWRKWEKDPAAADAFMMHNLFDALQDGNQDSN